MSMLCYFSPEAKPPRRRDSKRAALERTTCVKNW